MKKEYIYIGVAILAIGGLYYYNKNKDKANQDATLQAQNNAALAKKRDDLNKSISDKLANGYFSKKENFQDKLVQYLKTIKLFKETIDANIMTTDELNKINDFLLLLDNEYVGSKKPFQIQQEAKDVMVKYNLDNA